MVLEQTKSKVVRVYVAEKQEIYREVYGSLTHPEVPIELLDISGVDGMETLRSAILELCPDVLLIGIKNLDMDTIEGLEQIRSEFPNIGVVVLAGTYIAVTQKTWPDRKSASHSRPCRSVAIRVRAKTASPNCPDM